MSMSFSQSARSALPVFRAGVPQSELWQAVLNDPQLQDLPFKIEANQHGQLILSPHKRIHSLRQTQITDLLAKTVDAEGARSVELAIGTSKGVKVVDASWMSSERLASIPEEAEPTPVAPEICVEVRSGSNTEAEMEEKRALYFEMGAEEVWIVMEDGAVRFYDEQSVLSRSRLAPGFPKQLPGVV